jgi:hypothetical protein
MNETESEIRTKREEQDLVVQEQTTGVQKKVVIEIRKLEQIETTGSRYFNGLG